MTERWPPIYDADDLSRAIADVSQGIDQGEQFYSRESLVKAGPICQGDIISFPSPVPVIVIDSDGTPAEYGEPTRHWLIIGNTCDIHRSRAEVPWSQMVPIFDYGTASDFAPKEVAALRRYQYSRRFFVPQWSQTGDTVRIAELLLPVPVSKDALLNMAKVEARLSHNGWLLLHACLVRFLCRDDGRFDPGA